MEPNNKNFKECEICKIDATSLCLECISYFCDECYKYVHSKKENIGHKKMKIDYFVPIDVKCLQHPKIINNLFCIDDKGKYINYIILNIIILNRALLFFLLFFGVS